MILTAQQPHYLPDFRQLCKLSAGEVYLFADHLQFRKQSAVSRARLPGEKTTVLSVPIRKSAPLTISHLKIDGQSNWMRKHLRFMELQFKYFPYFDHYFPALKELYRQNCAAAADFWWALLQWHCKVLGLGKTVLRSREEGIAGRDDLVRWALKKGITGMAVWEEELPYYRQHFWEFELWTLPEPATPKDFPRTYDPHMAFLPLLFYYGPQAGEFLRGKSPN